MRKIIWLILALACLLYGLLIAGLRSGSPFWLVWEALGACFLLVFVLRVTGLSRRLPGLIRGAFCFGMAAAAVWIVCCMVLVMPRMKREAHPVPGLDYILVLGAQVWPEGPSRTLQYRLDTAAEYLADNPDTLCVVSGGQGSNEPFPEAEGMAEYLKKKGIPEERILLESRSRNTLENIRFCMELADLTRAEVGIVTNDFHLYRSVGIARRQGMTQAVGIAAPSNAFFLPNNLFRECFGLAKDLLKGNMSIWIY